MAPNDGIQRQVLPIPDRKRFTLTTYDANDPDTKFPHITPLRPPTGAPNVLIILLTTWGSARRARSAGVRTAYVVRRARAPHRRRARVRLCRQRVLSGQLDQGRDEAPRYAWVLAGMKRDWNRVFRG
jgi:hypothetical protein